MSTNQKPQTTIELLEGKGLSEVLRATLAKLPEDCTIAINPDNLL